MPRETRSRCTNDLQFHCACSVSDPMQSLYIIIARIRYVWWALAACEYPPMLMCVWFHLSIFCHCRVFFCLIFIHIYILIYNMYIYMLYISKYGAILCSHALSAQVTIVSTLWSAGNIHNNGNQAVWHMSHIAKDCEHRISALTILFWVLLSFSHKIIKHENEIKTNTRN